MSTMSSGPRSSHLSWHAEPVRRPIVNRGQVAELHAVRAPAVGGGRAVGGRPGGMAPARIELVAVADGGARRLIVPGLHLPETAVEQRLRIVGDSCHRYRKYGDAGRYAETYRVAHERDPTRI